MATKVFFYTLRPYDELSIAQRLAPQLDIEFGYTQEYPTLENAELAKGYDAVSVTPCDMSAPMVKRFHELGVKSICCRSIGYDHVDRETARTLGMKVANVDYPPNGVANFAIMLMLMSLRKAGHILKRGEAQDYSLQGKIGRDISTCTVGVIGTGRIGRTVLQHLSGFGCRLLAYDLYPNAEVKKIAEYVPLETLLAESDVITLHTNATEENHHLIDAKAIETMKPGVTIINTARGKLIDSDALIAGLESGKIGAAGLDVLENENGLYYYNRMGDVIPAGEFRAQGMRINYDRRKVFVDEQEIKLTQTEYNIVAFLSQHAGRVMTYAAIVKAIWGDTDIGSTKKLQVNMANIRKKLGSRPGSNAYILNELGVGYRMIDEDNDTHNRENLE